VNSPDAVGAFADRPDASRAKVLLSAAFDGEKITLLVPSQQIPNITTSRDVESMS
jgi:hypothetical protein